MHRQMHRANKRTHHTPMQRDNLIISRNVPFAIQLFEKEIENMAKDKNGKQLPPGITLRSDGRYMGRVQVDGERVTLYGKNLKELLDKIDN